MISKELAVSQMIREASAIVSSQPSYDYYVIQRLNDAMSTFFRRRQMALSGVSAMRYDAYDDYLKEVADATRFLNADTLIDVIDVIGKYTDRKSWNFFSDHLNKLPGGMFFFPHHFPEGWMEETANLRMRGLYQHRKLLGKFFTYSVTTPFGMGGEHLAELNAFGHHTPEAFNDGLYHFYFEKEEDEVMMRLKYPT